jgi:hypothetical protein
MNEGRGVVLVLMEVYQSENRRLFELSLLMAALLVHKKL